MSIYQIIFANRFNDLIPPNRRKTIWLAWTHVFAVPLQWLRDLFFDVYYGGFTGGTYSNVTIYNTGDRVRFTDKAVYEAMTDGVVGVAPNTDTDKWLKVVDVYIGLQERLTYNAQRLKIEFTLNKWFETAFRQPTSYVASPDFYLPKSDIFITDLQVFPDIFLMVESNMDEPSYMFKQNVSQGMHFMLASASSSNYDLYNFTINIPVAVFNALAPNNLQREKIVRQVADKYVGFGLTYNIVTY